MPYLTPKNIEELPKIALRDMSPGERNYTLTKLVIDSLEGVSINYSTLANAYNSFMDHAVSLTHSGDYDVSEHYDELQQWSDAAKLARMEFYRRVIVPYEELKIRQNGDLYEDLLNRLPVEKD